MLQTLRPLPLLLLMLSLGTAGCILQRPELRSTEETPDGGDEPIDAFDPLDAGRDAFVPPNTDAHACGDGIRHGMEECDDGALLPGDGCSASCTTERGFDCSGSACVAVCADSMVVGDETCDDGNGNAGDGCDATCRIEMGFTCEGAPSLCKPICGDGRVLAGEACDDSNTVAGDGCSSCMRDNGFECMGAPSMCRTTCGDGVIAGEERCDDGRPGADGDGCSGACAIEPGYTCAGAPSVCVIRCGDGVVGGTETCDDGNNVMGDGCSPECAIVSGFTCSGAPSVCVSRCGDGVVAAGREACDDGALGAGDGCSPTCTVEAGASCAAFSGLSRCSRTITYDPPNVPIPRTGEQGLVTLTFSGSVSCTPTRVRSVALNMRHTAAGDLLIAISDGAPRAVLTNRQGGARDMDGVYTFASNTTTTVFPGPGGVSDPIPATAYNTVDGTGNRTLVLQDVVGASGNWTLTIDDQETGDVGEFRSVTIAIYCAPNS